MTRSRGKKAKKRLQLNVYRSSIGAFPSIPAGELLLEYFSDDQLKAWRSRGKALQDYHYLWFFELERQRAANQQQILDALRVIPGITVELRGWGCAMSYRYSHLPLSCLGSLKWVGGRFNYGVDIDETRFPPFPALYLAEDTETGLREMNGLVREDQRAGLTANELALCTTSGAAWVVIEGRAHNIFAIRPAANLMGHLLSQAGFEGVLYSSTITDRANLALFPRQLHKSATIVRVVEPPPNAHCIELSADNYPDAERQDLA